MSYRETGIAGLQIDEPLSKKLRLDGSELDAAEKKNNMQRYLVTLEYIGSRYSGFQKQKEPRLRTIQGALEGAFAKFLGRPVESATSSRTLSPHEPEVVKRAVNHFLQRGGEDIQVVDVRCVPSCFHARFEAIERIYHYRILICKDLCPIFERDRCWHIQNNLDIDAMQEACKQLVGHHDFSSFRAAGCQASSPIKTLDELRVCEIPSYPCFLSQHERREQFQVGSQECSKGGGEGVSFNMGTGGMCVGPAQVKMRCLVVTARARSFLYHQVRLMVGLLKVVGCGEREASDVTRLLEARSITEVPTMAPACGLYLVDVKYDWNCM